MFTCSLPTFFGFITPCIKPPLRLLHAHLPQVFLLALYAFVANPPASWILANLCVIMPLLPISTTFLIPAFSSITFIAYLPLLELFLGTAYKEKHLIVIGLWAFSFLCVSLLERLLRAFCFFPAHEKDLYDDAELAPTGTEEKPPRILFHRYWLGLLFGMRLLTACLAYVYVFHLTGSFYMKLSILALLLVTGGINATMDDICGAHFLRNKKAALLISELLLVLMLFEGSLLEDIKMCSEVPPSNWESVPCSMYAQLMSF